MARDLRETLTSDLAQVVEANRALTARNGRLTSGLSLLARIAGLARSGDDRRATACAVLTGVTAGVGLGMNRAMVLVPSETHADARGDGRRDGDPSLEVLAAIGPIDRAEADRVWRSIERDAPDLETLYEVGSRTLATGSALDRALVGARGAGRPPLGLVLADGTRFDLDAPTALSAPLGGGARREGWLVADNAFTGRSPDDETRLLFGLVASLAGPALESAARFERVAREATTDALTGLASRRTGDAILRETCDAALLDARPVALVLLDLDDFKRINDTLGHPAGDAVLRTIGERVRAVLPPRTRGFRYGGEEIAVVCDGFTPNDAHALAQALWACIREEDVPLPSGRLRVTASIGVATARGGSPAALVQHADDALLGAKRNGKDRVELAP
jgi:diguanylate cyclase (GGDEF)-like protein